eukprot:TRINITY_DN3929_c2_g1_i2.p1 TRINITY_DN3929_c2_g1~~TRINITY_DN3929_c2_g1_i2.p1  ORF type:complete len:305 (+),score=46.49 TRINITY_DN3929_c2_g1_i2:113-916(+)
MAMLLYVRSQTRTDPVALEVPPTATVGELSAAAAAALGVARLRLLWQGTELSDDSAPLADVGVSNEAELAVQEGGAPVVFREDMIGYNLRLDGPKWCGNTDIHGHSFCFTENTAEVPPEPGGKLSMPPMTLVAEEIPGRDDGLDPPIWGIGILAQADGWTPGVESGNNSCTGNSGVLFCSEGSPGAVCSIGGQYQRTGESQGLPIAANWKVGDEVTIEVIDGLAVLSINGERRANAVVPVENARLGRCPRMGLAVSLYRGGAWRAKY